jgi:hypothetical protein
MNRSRFALVLCLGAYPLITALLYLWHPLLAELPTWQVTLVIVPQMVPGMVFGVIPLVHRYLGGFIRGA